jgi:hypothetical protein
MRIVLVYLGQKIPKYARKNLLYLAHTFPERQIVLLIDNAKIFNVKSINNVEIIRLQDPSISWTNGNRILKSANNFKNDFWYKTLARFKAIEDYMITNSESLLHIEADVLLSRNFPFTSIESIKENFAFSLVNHTQGIASLLYIKNHEAAKSLLNYSEDALTKNPKYTDMDILGELYREKRKDVHVLPTVDSKSILLADSFKTYNVGIMNNSSKFNGLFDAATLGQYFFGLDRIHTHGFLKTKIYLPHHFVDPRKVDMMITEGNFYAVTKDDKIEIYTLHLHSKINKFFSLNSKNLKNFIDNKKFKKIGTFSFISYYNSKIYIVLHQLKKIRNFLD